MAKRRRKRNPVNLDRYGDLFYDAAASFNEFVDELITVAFNVDRTNEKISRKMVKAAAVAIVERWEQIARGKRPLHDTSGLSELARGFGEIVDDTTATVFKGDLTLMDESAAYRKKLFRAQRQIAGGILKAWLRAYY